MEQDVKKLPTELIYYVYTHRHPETGSVVYVGMGQKDRAWRMGNSKADSSKYGNRSEVHYHWFLSLESSGYTLHDIVHLEAIHLTKQDALDMEKELISFYSIDNILFNKDASENPNLALDEKDLEFAMKMKQEGNSYKYIGLQLGVSTMTVYRALNGQTKGYL